MNPHEQELCDTCLQADYDDFRHTCVHESMDLNESLKTKYKITSWPRWGYQMEDATLIFSEDGKARVVCEMQVAGSTKGETWQWSWGNPHTPEASRKQMCKVHEFGTAREWDRMTTLFLPNDEYVGWECAAIANHLLGGLGVYRCPTSGQKERNDGLVDAVYVVILSASFVS